MKNIVLLEKTKAFANLQQSQERKNKIKTSDFWFLYESCGELQKPRLFSLPLFLRTLSISPVPIPFLIFEIHSTFSINS